MASDKFIQLIQNLLRATEDGKLGWQQTAKEGVFRIALGDGLVRIECLDEPPSTDIPYYAAYLVDRRGQTIDQIRTHGNSIIDSDLMLDELYKAARLSALNTTNAVIDSMLKDIEAGRTREIPPDN